MFLFIIMHISVKKKSFVQENACYCIALCIGRAWVLANSFFKFFFYIYKKQITPRSVHLVFLFFLAHTDVWITSLKIASFTEMMMTKNHIVNVNCSLVVFFSFFLFFRTKNAWACYTCWSVSRNNLKLKNHLSTKIHTNTLSITLVTH